jgi:hypothetical protein
MPFRKKKGLEFLTKWWFLLQDNAQPHIVHVMTETLAYTGGKPVEYPPYSPDLTLCDWAFLMVKYTLNKQKFSSDAEVKQATAATLRKMSGNGLLHMPEE